MSPSRSAEQIEGAVGGLVNLRTAMPFDFKGRKGAISVEATRSQLRGKVAPSFSALLSDRWETGIGQIGALVDVAGSRIKTRSDGLAVSPYIPRTDAVVGDTNGKLRWIPAGGSWNRGDFDRDRQGLYGARMVRVQKFYVSEGIVSRAAAVNDLFTNQFIGTAR
eukprot:gene28259-31918_t